MKFLDRLINFIFSLVMVVFSVVVLLVMFDLADSSFVNGLLNDYVWNVQNKTIVIGVASLVFLAGLKTTIFLADFRKKKKIPIMVASDNGNVQIAAEMIESTAKAVAKSHEEVKEVNAKMVSRSKGVDIFMSLLVSQDTNIRALTIAIQEEVKNKIHDTTGVLVLNTDIKVKNIVEKKKIVSEEPLVVKGKIEKELPEEKVEENVGETVVSKESEVTPSNEEETKE